MKRSEINRHMAEAESLFASNKFHLPPWAFFSPADWEKKGKGRTYAEIRDNKLGWDLTDFGGGDFEQLGLLLFTIRNGNLDNPACNKNYAEKIMVVRERQITPIHFHWKKMEDIINRGGGRLVIKLWKADAKEGFSNENFTVQVDGVTRRLAPGGQISLSPGESICLEPYIYHTFWAEDAVCMVGEVSMVNDDANDNRFYESVGRFPRIEEDEPPRHLLCNEYP